MRVADVGAGDGEWTEALSREVGDEGHVFATEVDEGDLEEIRERLDDIGAANVTTILGDDVDTGLPEECCDAILLRQVYHHFTDPEAMRESLKRALRTRARIAIIEIKPQTSWSELPGVPDRGGHGILPDDLVAEMKSGGFRVVTRLDDWDDDNPDRYCVVFEADDVTPPASAP